MIRVLIVDDSAVVRKVLTDELQKFEGIEVIASAVDPYDAREKIARLRPDVLTLDIEMPRMDGLSFLSKLMKSYPLPVVIVSSLTPKNSETAIRALQLGALEIVPKPSSQYSTPEAQGLVRAIRAAASSKISASRVPHSGPVLKTESQQLVTTHKVVAIGASTGGTTAVEAVLSRFPPTGPGTLVVQHMPEHFTAAFASRLDKVCAITVREARDGDALSNGLALIAPGNKHMLLERSGAQYFVRVKEGPLVYFQRPSVDVLFYSVAKKAGKNAVGVLLTGMGADGARGLLEMRKRGAETLVQNEETCVVFGMPREALKLDAAGRVAPLGKIAETILSLLSQPQRELAS